MTWVRISASLYRGKENGQYTAVLACAGGRWHMTHNSFMGGYMGWAATLEDAQREVERFAEVQP